MAATSGTFNLVEITKVEYGDADLVAGVVPVSLKTIGDIKEGQMNLDFPEASTTAEYSEQTQQPYRIRKAPVMRTATIELVTSLMTEVKDFLPGTFTAGSTGTTPDKLAIKSSGSIANKYVKVTGKNTVGQVVTVELLNAFVTNSWSGAMGANQETRGLMVKFNLLQDASANKEEVIISAAF